MLVKHNGNVGIGISSPGAALHVAQGGGGSNGIKLGEAGVASGNIFSDGSIYMGIDGNNSGTGETFRIYHNGSISGNELFRVQDNGNVGIGRTAPDSRLHLADTYDGNLRLLRLTNLNQQGNDACGILWQLPRSGGAEFESGEIYVAKENGSWTGTPGTVDSQMIFKVIQSESLGTAMTIGSDKEIHGNFDDTSDRSLKKNIKELSSTLDKVNFLKPSSFNWKVSAERSDKNQIGFIAQEVEEQFEELVSAKTVEDVELKSINTIGLVAVLTKAVQELSAKVTALENA
tara:strand:- start:29 stop:892 length:864 start_codon:yes stop_codon:yes gene_type:complete